jgi:hypothetical protein
MGMRDLWSRAQGACERFMDCPPALQATGEGTPLEAALSSPLRQRHRAVVIGQPMVISFVVLLLHWQCPKAVLLRIIAVVVAAFYRVFWARTWSHVGKKGIKRLPFDADTSSAIGEIRSGVLVATTGLHGSPTSMGSCSRHAMGYVFVPCFFSPEATATFSALMYQGIRLYDLAIPTGTLTEPPGITRRAVCYPLQDGQSSKRLLSEVKKIRVRHDVSSVCAGSVCDKTCGDSHGEKHSWVMTPKYAAGHKYIHNDGLMLSNTIKQ